MHVSWIFFKLLENKIDDQFYNLIKSLYSNSKCAVKQSKTRTDFFNYCKGVRQGCILRPLLFNIYINELATLFENNSADPFKLPNGTKLSCLLYADDLIIPATILDKTLETIPANITKLLNIDKTNFVSPSPPVQCCEQRRNNFW